MLHPGIGSSRDPLASWQVDTQEIDTVVGLYERHLSDASDSERLTMRLGLLWKKLGTAPRLARLIVDYTHWRLQAIGRSSEAGRRGGPRLVGRVLAALRQPISRPDARPPLVFIEDDPLYDQWVDG
jgi:hypothetical protein